MKRRLDGGRILILALLLLLGLHLFWSLPGSALAADSATASAYPGLKANTAAPDFDLPDLNGASVKLSQYKGERPVLLYFWATWCPYCIQAKPKVAKLRDSLGEKDLQILAINVGTGDSLEKVKKYQEGHPVSWPVLYDKEGKIAKTYQADGIPLFILVNKQGEVVYRNHVPPESKDMAKYLQ